MIFGERLRQLRVQKKMSQGDLETKTGLLRCYTSRVENGHTVPSLDTIQKYAKALGIEMYQFFSEKGATVKGAGPISLELDKPANRHLRQLSSILTKVPMDKRTMLVKFARALAK